MWDYIKKLMDDHQITMFLTTHYMEEADILCDCISIVYLRKIVALDTRGTTKTVLAET